MKLIKPEIAAVSGVHSSTKRASAGFENLARSLGREEPHPDPEASHPNQDTQKTARFRHGAFHGRGERKSDSCIGGDDRIRHRIAESISNECAGKRGRVAEVGRRRSIDAFTSVGHVETGRDLVCEYDGKWDVEL